MKGKKNPSKVISSSQVDNPLLWNNHLFFLFKEKDRTIRFNRDILLSPPPCHFYCISAFLDLLIPLKKLQRGRTAQDRRLPTWQGRVSLCNISLLTWKAGIPAGNCQPEGKGCQLKWKTRTCQRSEDVLRNHSPLCCKRFSFSNSIQHEKDTLNTSYVSEPVQDSGDFRTAKDNFPSGKSSLFG